MSWTVHKEESEISDKTRFPTQLHVRAIIDLDKQQDELKALIEALQKHVTP